MKIIKMKNRENFMRKIILLLNLFLVFNYKCYYVTEIIDINKVNLKNWKFKTRYLCKV